MIESRYKIEYVLPEKKQKKSNSYRFVAYFSLLLLVGALVSVFTITSLSNESLALFGNIKNKMFELNIGQPEQITNKKEHKSEYFLATVADPIPVPDISEEAGDNGNNSALPEDVVFETEEVEESEEVAEVAEVASNEQQTVQTNNTNNEAEVNKIVENIEKSLSKTKEVLLVTTEKQTPGLKPGKLQSSDTNKDLQPEKAPEIQPISRQEIITNLVKSALSNAATIDKEYISAINAATSKNESNKAVYLTNTVNIKSTVVKTPKDVNQAISEEKSSEIDAIIADMKGDKPKKDKKPVTYQTQLQQQIDKQIINATASV